MAYKNFSYGRVATAPSPASSGTSLVLQAGEGARMPPVPFKATVWPFGFIPLFTNAEIVNVTGRSVDTLTIQRAQEGTNARSILVGDQFIASLTQGVLDSIEARVAAVEARITTIEAGSGIGAMVFDTVQIVNGASHVIGPNSGFLIVLRHNADRVATLLLTSGAAYILDQKPLDNFGTSDLASATNVFMLGGNFVLQNNSGETNLYTFYYFPWGSL